MLTLTDEAAAIGVSRSTLSRYKQGVHPMSRKSLDLIEAWRKKNEAPPKPEARPWTPAVGDWVFLHKPVDTGSLSAINWSPTMDELLGRPLYVHWVSGDNHIHPHHPFVSKDPSPVSPSWGPVPPEWCSPCEAPASPNPFDDLIAPEKPWIKTPNFTGGIGPILGNHSNLGDTTGSTPGYLGGDPYVGLSNVKITFGDDSPRPITLADVFATIPDEDVENVALDACAFMQELGESIGTNFAAYVGAIATALIHEVRVAAERRMESVETKLAGIHPEDENP